MSTDHRPRKAHGGTVTPSPGTPPSEWARPISEDCPCGPNLEYDNEYAVLLAKLRPQTEVQYGAFVGQPEPLDWSEIERDCRRLLLRSKDILLLICLCRCRARLAGAAGLAQALEGMLEVLQTYPDSVHPQLEVEGQWDPVVRANAMANLADPDGLIADVRDIVVVSHTALRLSVKDIERSFSLPRPPEAMPSDLMQQQLADLQSRGSNELPALARAAAAIEAIAAWSRQNLQEAAPKLDPLQQLLTRISPPAQNTPQDRPSAAEPPSCPDGPKPAEADASPSPKTQDTRQPPSPAPHSPAIDELLALSDSLNINMPAAQGRELARKVLAAVRVWLQTQEPSSPVAVVLQQAEQMIGMRYSELSKIIPIEIYLNWENNFHPPPS